MSASPQCFRLVRTGVTGPEEPRAGGVGSDAAGSGATAASDGSRRFWSTISRAAGGWCPASSAR